MTSHNAVRANWKPGVLVGLGAAGVSTLTLLGIGAVTGRGLHLLTDAGMGDLPTLHRPITGASPALRYLLGHAGLDLLAGLAVPALVRLVERFPAFITGLVLLVIMIEMGFLVFTTEAAAMSSFGASTWRALLIAHAVGDLTFVLGVLRAHPRLRPLLVHGYDD
jgi:hypothetical protein